MGQQELDAAILRYYDGHHDEDDRLQARSVGGRVEFIRTQRLVSAVLRPRSRILDVGGATGIHSRWLAAAGHDVTLLDPAPGQVARAAAIGTFRAEVGDARALPVPDGSVDAVLLLGPLYHLISREDRLLALAEAHRALAPGGAVCAQGIGRLSALADTAAGDGFGRLADEDWEIVRTGEWVNRGEGVPGGHFHSATELRDEVLAGGFAGVQLHGLEGPNVGALELAAPDDGLVDLAVALAERMEAAVAHDSRRREALADCSPHILAIARKPD